MFDWSNLISIIGGIVVGGGGVLFYKQNKTNKEITNASMLANEWEKLYREQKAERERNTDKISELSARVLELEQKVNRLEIEKENLKNQLK